MQKAPLVKQQTTKKEHKIGKSTKYSDYDPEIAKKGQNKIRPIKAKDLEDFSNLQQKKINKIDLSFDKSIEINSAFEVEKRNNDFVSKELELID